MVNRRRPGKRRGATKKSPPADAVSAAAIAAAELKARRSPSELDDDVVERALLTGELAGPLEDYFGAAAYLELQQLAREVAARGVRGGPKVLILPGIMGSKIGVKSKFGGVFDDVTWLDPLDVAAGNLKDLALPGGQRFTALGVILLAYLRLKLRLRRAGYDAIFYPFDWRLSIAELGKQLADKIAALEGRQLGSLKGTVSLVAHSMGGLVARWALAHGAKCNRLIMLGTPNHGSFAPVLALRAIYPLVRKLGAVDQAHDAEWLSDHVFRTFPGLLQMLPTAARFNAVNLYDLASWPPVAGGKQLRPTQALLDGVGPVQQALATGGENYFLIAGVDQETVVGVRRDEAGHFAYETSLAGDGTVPLDLALLRGEPGAKTYYARESHGSLPNNARVGQAVADILARGSTDSLPDSLAVPPQRATVRVVPESELRIDPYPGRRGAALSQRETRELIEEVAAPDSTQETVAPQIESRPGPATEGRLETGYEHAFDRVVVGRRRQHRLDLRFALGDIAEADARALALGVFRDVAPSGAAMALDARLDGAITEFTRRRMFSGDVGEIFMIPTGRHLLRADLIAFVGLGSFDRFNHEVLQTAAENVIRTFIRSRVEEFATVLFGAGSGESPARALRNLLIGFIRGICDADHDHQFRRLLICERNPERYLEVKQELYRLSSTALCQDVEITFDESTLPKPAAPPGDPARSGPERVDPAYLIVRQERENAGSFEVRSSVLSAGSKAAVVTGVVSVEKSALQAALDAVDQHQGADLAGIGASFADLLCPEVRTVLPRQRDRHLVVVHDAPLSKVPWEVMALALDGGKTWQPAGEKGLSHLYAADNLSVAKWLEERIRGPVLQVLLVVNPTLDLDGAEKEGARVRQLFDKLPGCQLDELEGAEATRPALLEAFGSGRYDVIHYAGHAVFDETSRERSGILCHGRTLLTGSDLAGLGNLPTLVFFNACESGRVRSSKIPAPRKVPLKKRVVEAVGFAEAFMRGGVANFLGTYWPVGDASATTFADVFYREVLRGRPISQALQEGRRQLREDQHKDWADYLFYGDPNFVLKLKEGQPAAPAERAKASSPVRTVAKPAAATRSRRLKPAKPAPKRGRRRGA